jgi:hypothetical protein
MRVESTSALRFRWASLPGLAQKPIAIVVAFLLWIPAVGAGVQVLLHYAQTPGLIATPPSDWPRNTSIARNQGRMTLLVFAHPQCPCSQATVGELASIMARSGRELDSYVLFYAPRSEDRAWIQGGLWQAASAIPGVHVVEDTDGKDVRRFGAATSGQTLLYDSTGRLAFNGGITAGRGHLGDNDGLDAVIALLQHKPIERHKFPVFGCSLLGQG